MSELPLTFPQQLRKVQAAGEDHEWYPTTDEIIRALVKDFTHILESDQYDTDQFGFLDIGAGNGKVLDSIRASSFRNSYGRTDNFTGKCFAIEKSQTLLNLLDPSIFILGCDFWNTSLHDKSLGFIFSNPPYSRFAEWTEKILREAPPSATIWLVIPERWQNNSRIQAEISFRKATTTIIGTFDFQDAEDRKARAKVHLLRITFPEPVARYYRRHHELPEDMDTSPDPFTRFFEETFAFADDEDHVARPFSEQLEETQVVHRANFIEALCILYQARMAELHRNYQAVCDISPSILKEFEISKTGLIASLKMKIDTAKKEYWQRLFDGMSEINTRLTCESRKAICGLMNSQTGIDFNRENAYAVVLWVVKNANGYFDQQLIDVYANMADKANVENYVSNKRVIKWNRWEYSYRHMADMSHFRLKVGHRTILTHTGGIRVEYGRRYFAECARNFVSDLCTIAYNLGFSVNWDDVSLYAPNGYEYNTHVTDSTPFVIRYKASDGKQESLMRVRAFDNGNLHIQFLPDFIHALNTAHGRLKGWLRDDAEAAAELEIPTETAARFFKENFRLQGSSLRLMAPAENAA